MSSKIVLIDGHSILNRAFYGLPDLTNAEGLHTNAIYGFLTIMFKLLEEEKPEYLTVAFDVHAPTFRHKMYAEYKGTRKPMADELRQQVPVIKEVLHAMGVKTIECAGLEADDLIGTLSNRCENEGMEVTVISGDRDLLQLATEHVKIRIPKTKQGKTEIEDYYAKDVEERYQVTPKEFIDLKALMGDTADNIPGVPSIGEKTATKIITQYHSIEEAHEHVDELKPPRASKALSEHWDLAVLSKELATINVKADFPYELSEAKLGNLYTEEAYIFFQKLEFKNLLSRFDVSAPANKVEDGFKIITSKSEAEKVFVQAEEASTIGAVIFKDLENVLPLFADQAGLGGIGLCFSKEESYCIKVEKDITGEWLLKKLADVAEKAETYAMFHLKESMEQVTIRNQANCFDVSVAAYLLNPLKNNYTWEDVAREHLGLMIDEKIDQDMKACYESYVNYASVEVLRQKLRDTKMDTLFRDIEMPLVFTLFDMEQNGIRVEADALKQYGDQLAGKIAELEKEIYEEAGETFNINSPKQLGVVLFENMKLPGGRKTKTGYSTAADVLEKLAPEHPVVAKILEYRQYTKLKSTYADGLANYIQDDGRIHGKFNQTITATGRISSTEPNLQNIPVRMEIGRQIRKVFVPKPGCVFLDADYSQIELRILAHMSQDDKLIAAYNTAQDIHAITASQVFHVPLDEVTRTQRSNAKAVNFGIIYGISSFGLSQDLSISRKEASEYIEQYFATYPHIKEFIDGLVASAKKNGYSTTMFGRRRPVPELNSSNFMQRQFGERIAMNSPIQGSAADIIKIAMINVSRALKDNNLKSKMILQVHDELLIETYEDEVDAVRQILIDNMTNAASLRVPLEVDVKEGHDWLEAH